MSSSTSVSTPQRASPGCCILTQWWERHGKTVSPQTLEEIQGIFYPEGEMAAWYRNSCDSFDWTIGSALPCMKYIYTRHCVNKVRRIIKNPNGLFSLLLTKTTSTTMYYILLGLYHKITSDSLIDICAAWIMTFDVAIEWCTSLWKAFVKISSFAPLSVRFCSFALTSIWFLYDILLSQSPVRMLSLRDQSYHQRDLEVYIQKIAHKPVTTRLTTHWSSSLHPSLLSTSWSGFLSILGPSSCGQN